MYDSILHSFSEVLENFTTFALSRTYYFKYDSNYVTFVILGEPSSKYIQITITPMNQLYSGANAYTNLTELLIG